MDYKLTSALLVLGLAAIAAIVFVGQVKKKNVWWLICLYWLVLTIKNVVDWMGMRG